MVCCGLCFDARMPPVGGVACRPCAALAILQEATVWFTLRSVLGVGLVLASTRTLVTLVASALAALLPPSGVVAGVAVHCRVFLCCHHENAWKPMVALRLPQKKVYGQRSITHQEMNDFEW